ncbi:hypothetical protein K6I33_005021, partial [Streptomyces sp. UNOB3_S3]|nr:hypothetical protein [Streptomyces sp. UNOB3_S3]
GRGRPGNVAEGGLHDGWEFREARSVRRWFEADFWHGPPFPRVRAAERHPAVTGCGMLRANDDFTVLSGRHR